MSADNFIEVNFDKKLVILSNSEGAEYRTKTFTSLVEALKIAQKMQDEWQPEYGIVLIGKIDEQKNTGVV